MTHRRGVLALEVAVGIIVGRDHWQVARLLNARDTGLGVTGSRLSHGPYQFSAERVTVVDGPLTTLFRG
jgi:hypothetical protein